MRGYFAIGIDGVSKTGNIGNLVRTAHAFGASFAFAVNPKVIAHSGELVTKPVTDTSKSAGQMPFFTYASADEVPIPEGCQLVGIEITDDAVDLPSFRHPLNAIYVLGGERKSLSPSMAARCDHMIKIPTKFSLNVATAGAIVLYDRHRLLGGYPERPVMAGQEVKPRAEHVHGGSFSRLERREKRAKTQRDTKED
ncbi:RNA methyltransferase [Kordiimonas marina]|uniref:RNA methyltransferase n=1 Tax=Kordiimonas marina TaxID=2872312 RepID=UPI001FF23DFB|nr:RNA methyltransferase [Kordiimonas marina]MCJ9428102.1 RNA methyltransferase [Kordiimonas marina]